MRKHMVLAFVMAAAIPFVCTACAQKPAENGEGPSYRFVSEESPHEGTWLIWPHDHSVAYHYNEEPDNALFTRDDLESVWVAMTKALHTGETVHIVAYDEAEKRHITERLTAEGVDMDQIDFFIYPTNDVWARDTGPIFVYDEKNNKFVIANFRFDGWGEKQEYDKDDGLAQAVADAYGIDILQIPELVLEGGSFECDGAGTLLAAKSSVVSENRNADKTLPEVEAILAKYLGVTNFIWIEGSVNEDITDAHIDGIAKFINDRQIFICSEEEYKELFEFDPDEKDWASFVNAKNAKGEPYELVHLPLTKNTVRAYGVDKEYQVGYTNHYVGNKVVLVPQFGDPNDAVALEIIAKYYPGRTVIGIDCSKLIYFGGMIHCITQQQPA